MNVPRPNSRVLKHITRLLPDVRHGVDAHHRCQLGGCAMSSWPVRFRGTRAQLYVCRNSLQYHVCGRGVCDADSRQARDGTRVCTISAFEVRGPAEVYYPSRAKGRGSWSRPFSHTMTRERPKHKRKVGISATRACQTALASLLLSPTAQKLRALAVAKSAAAVTREGAASAERGDGFYAAMAATRAKFAHRRDCTRHVHDMPRRVRLLARDIVAYLQQIRPHLRHYKGYPALCAACVGFLATGLSVGGVTIFPCVPWIKAVAPKDTDYGKFPGFQSRPLSVASRSIKTSACSAIGAAKVPFIFKYSGTFA